MFGKPCCRLLIAAAFLLFAGTLAAPTLAAGETAYRLGAGDRIKVSVFGERDLSGTFEVNGAQTVALPLIGEVRAGALTVRELETVIERRLRQGYLKDPKVSVEVANYRPFYIIGEVKRPGSYPYVSNMTVLNAVALSGGFTHRARKSRVYLTRASDPDKKEAPVPTGTVILPGDVIRVAERFF